MFEIGYGALELRPSELWGLTLAELYQMAEGYRWRMEQTRELLAWHAANVMQPHVKRRLSAGLLLGRQSSRMSLPSSREEFNAMMAKAKRLEN